MLTYKQFKDEYLGKSVGYPDNNSYKNECLSLVKWYMKDCFGFNPPPSGVNAAYGYWTNFPAPLPDYFTKVPNSDTNFPAQGDVMIWNTKYGKSGHIAVVDSADANSFTCLSQNDPVGQPTILKSYKYVNVYGWLHPKGSMADTIPVDKKDFENLVKKSGYWDGVSTDLNVADLEGYKSVTAGYRARITDLSNQLGTAQAEVKNREEQVSRLKDEVLAINKVLEERTLQVNQFAREKGELAIQVEQLTVQVETLKQAQAQGEVTITLKEFIHLLLNQKITIKK